MQAITLFTGASARRLTRAEYDRMVKLGFFERERVELVHGMVVRMAPIGPPHCDVVDRLNDALLPPLLRRARVRVQQPFVACDESEPEPDVAVVPDQRYAESHPEQAYLVIEVADTSLEYDRETKAPLYAASRVAEYWIVDLQNSRIEVYDLPVNGRYTRVRHVAPGESLSCAAFPDVVVRVGDLLGA